MDYHIEIRCSELILYTVLFPSPGKNRNLAKTNAYCECVCVYRHRHHQSKNTIATKSSLQPLKGTTEQHKAHRKYKETL